MTRTANTADSGTQSSPSGQFGPQKGKAGEYRDPEVRETTETTEARSEPRKAIPGTRFLIVRAGELSTIRFTYDFERETEKELIRRLNEETAR